MRFNFVFFAGALPDMVIVFPSGEMAAICQMLPERRSPFRSLLRSVSPILNCFELNPSIPNEVNVVPDMVLHIKFQEIMVFGIPAFSRVATIS
jgi:hypothetical protein